MLTAPFELTDSRVIMAVRIKGQGPFPFVVDTGGVIGLIRDDAAKRLGLPVIGRSMLGGAGGKDMFALYRADDVVMGDAWRQNAAVFAAAGNLSLAPGVIGSLAAGVLTTVDADLDFDKSEIRIYPDGRDERVGYTRIPSLIEHRGPVNGSAYIFADVELDGHTFRFVVDTGTPRPLMLFADAARKTTLWDDTRPFAPLRGNGLGGMGPLGRMVRAEQLNFAGVTIDRPLVMLAGAKTGYALEDGIIGLAMLRRFNLSFDTKARALWVQASHRPPVPERYPLSGIWLEQQGSAVVVDAVGTGSPAAEAGMRAGDTIVGLGFADAIRAVKGETAGAVPLTIERGGAQKTVTLMLRPYL